MGLHLITGPATAGKTGLLFQETLKRAALRGLPVVVVPDAPDVRRTQEELAARTGPGVLVAQLDQWIERLWRLHGGGEQLVTSVVRAELMGQAIHQASREGEGPPFSPGLVAVLSDLVQRVERDKLSPTSGTERRIAEVLEGYWKLLDAHSLKERSAAAFELGQNPPSGVGPVGVNHFTDLSWSQEAFLVGLSRQTDVCIALTWVSGMRATQALDPLVERLLAAGASHTTTSAGRWTEPGLQNLAEELFSGVTGASTRCDALECIAAAGAGGESSAVADRVAQLISDGLEPEKIAIVARRMASRSDELVRALGARNVSSDLDVMRPFSVTPFGRALSGLLTAATDPQATREQLLSYVLSPYSGVAPKDAMDLDRRLRRSRARGADLARDIGGISPMEDTVRLLRRIVRQDAREAAVSWHLLGSRMLAEALRLSESQDRQAADAAAHNALMRAVEELLVAGLPVGPSSVLGALRGVVVAGERKAPGAVHITEAHRLKGRRFKAVIIMGLNAEEFSPERDPQLSVELARGLGGHPSADERATERMLFYAIFTRASERLILSRQATNDRHERLRPSVFWDEVHQRVAWGADGDSDASFGLASAVQVPAVLSLPSITPGRLLARARGTGAPRVGRRQGLDRARAQLQSSLDEREISASQLERYLACPYRWYLDYVLRPSEIDVTLGAREAGSFSHGLLKSFYDRWNALGHQRVSPDRLDEALALYEEVQLEHAATWQGKSDGLAEEIELAAAGSRARSIVIDDADITPGFAPVAHEMPFGAAAGREFVFGGVRIGGRIDRVESGPAGVVAVDYKSTTAIAGANQLLPKGLLQPIIYAVAASEHFGAPVAGGVYRSLRNLKVRGFWKAGCLDLGGRGTRTDALEPEGIEALIEDARGVVSRAYEGMRAGAIDPRPLAGACEHCLAAQVCPREAS